MRLFPKKPKDVRVNTEDSLGHGMDAVIVLALFLGLGYVIDRIVGTMPVFMIVMTVLGCIGLFARFKYSYDARMDQHEAERVAKLAGHTSVTSKSEAA